MDIRLHAVLRRVVGASSTSVEARRDQTVGDVLRALVAAQPGLAPYIWDPDGTLAGHVAVVLEGRDIRHLDGLDTPLGDAEHLDLFPPVGGGARAMAHITLKFIGEFWGRVGFGHAEFEFEGETVREFLPAVTVAYDVADLLLNPDGLSTRPSSRLVINGRFFELVGGLDAPIREGDVVTLMRPYAPAF